MSQAGDRLTVYGRAGAFLMLGVFSMSAVGAGLRALSHGRRRRPAAVRTVAVGLGLALVGSLGLVGSPAIADAVTDVVPVGTKPSAVAVNSVTGKAYVATDYGVSVLDGVASAGILYQGDRPVDVAVNEVTNKIYVSETDGTVAVVDGVSRAVTSVPVGSSPGVVSVNPVTNKIYVGVKGGVTIIDGSTLATSSVPLAGGAQDIVVNPATGKVYVLSGGTIQVLGTGGTVTSSINIGAGGILALAVNVKTNKIYFTTVGRYGAGVHVIDGATDTVTDTIPSATFVGQLAVNPETNTVYVAGDSTSIDGFVQVIDGATKKQVAQLRTASRIREIMVNPGNNKAYAILSGRGVMVVDGDTLRETAD